MHAAEVRNILSLMAPAVLFLAARLTNVRHEIATLKPV